ncbi:hypothetical protein MGALJ_38050 [Mycobacterium gallinarum]|uniref:Uncharacterized protein n=1 Tax=Mycobacterium gallinarum TaxID=39689 RepID=A0A9W4FGK7_9MYCO|nr:NAD(P)(+) transhydrogenase (Re/Si-specific) subunit beta [Mycobacterium gallinarum]BBY94136.1 hypothetical protein MGALJ_38050 [Mycobacterium gallinarum]
MTATLLDRPPADLTSAAPELDWPPANRGGRHRLPAHLPPVDLSELDLVSATPRRAGGSGGRHRAPRPGSGHILAVTTLCLLTLGAVALCAMQLHTVDLAVMNGLGLISVLPVTMFVGVVLLNVGFIGALSLQRRYTWLLGIQLVLFVVLLHGITTVLESQPRFPISWIHAGFVEFIDRTGTTAPGLDARWSWPGFFALAASLVGSGDREALTPILTFTPVVSNLLYLVAFALLLGALKMSWQAKWLAAWLFCVLNWIGQDYFSPQGWTLLLYLLFVGLLVTWFRAPVTPRATTHRRIARAGRIWRRAWGDPTSGEAPPRMARPAERVVLLAVIVGLFAAATVSHQLSPFAMLMSAAGLVLARRCTLTGLPVLLGVILVAWISYLTYPYWSGHLGVIVGSVGDVNGTVSANVVTRTSHSSEEHQLVLYARIATTLLLFAMAAWGLLRRRRRRIEDRVLLVLIVVPVLLVLLQSYGGEIAMRVYLFSLAPACVLAALAFFPHPSARPSMLARAAAAVCTLGLLFSFFLTRYGNEQFEQITDETVATVESIYEQMPAGGHFLFVSGPPTRGDTPFMPLGYRDVEKVSLTNTEAPGDPSDVSGVLARLREQGPGTYLITTKGQEDYLSYGEGFAVDWGPRFRQALSAAPGMRIVLDNPDATVYTLDHGASHEPVPYEPPATGIEVGKTEWTAIGLVFLVLLLGILGVREAMSARLGPAAGRLLRPLTIAAIPLLIGFALVVLERFMSVI